MKANSDTITVHADVTDDKGRALEPEEKLARREIGFDVDVSLGSGPENARRVGSANMGRVTADLTALEAAQMMGRTCSRCAYWDRAGWAAVRKAWNDPSNAEGFVTLNRIRAEILDRGAEGMVALLNGAEVDDVEHALASEIAICRALTDAVKEITLTHVTGCCPAALEDGTPFADTFKPAAGGEAARGSTAVYDTVLRRAQGR